MIRPSDRNIAARPPAGPLASPDACTRPRHRHRAWAARSAQRHHRRRRASASATRRSSRRRTPGRRDRAGPDRRHRRRAPRRRPVDRTGLRRLPSPERQRRADRARVDPRIRAARRRHRPDQHAQRRRRPRRSHRPGGGRRRTALPFWSLPVVGETWDGSLNDVNGFHVRPEHVAAAVGGGERRAGRRGRRRRRHRDGLPRVQGRDRDGVAGRPRRGRAAGRSASSCRPTTASASGCAIDGVPVGEAIPTTELSIALRRIRCGRRRAGRARPRATGPVPKRLDHHPGRDRRARCCPTSATRLAQRAGLGLARMGGTGGHYSGDLFLAWATGNRHLPDAVR